MNELRLTDSEPGLWARVPRRRRSCTRHWRLPGSRAKLVVRWIAKNLRASVRRHRRAQGDRSTLRSIRPKRARMPAMPALWEAPS